MKAEELGMNSCDGLTMRKILEKYNENLRKPIPASTPFRLVHDDGSKTDYEFNNSSCPARIGGAVLDTIVVRSLDAESLDLAVSYAIRIEALFDFVRRNHEELQKLGLIQKGKRETLFSYSLFDAIALAKLDKKGMVTWSAFNKAIKKAS